MAFIARSFTAPQGWISRGETALGDDEQYLGTEPATHDTYSTYQRGVHMSISFGGSIGDFELLYLLQSITSIIVYLTISSLVVHNIIKFLLGYRSQVYRESIGEVRTHLLGCEYRDCHPRCRNRTVQALVPALVPALVCWHWCWCRLRACVSHGREPHRPGPTRVGSRASQVISVANVHAKKGSQAIIAATAFNKIREESAKRAEAASTGGAFWRQAVYEELKAAGMDDEEAKGVCQIVAPYGALAFDKFVDRSAVQSQLTMSKIAEMEIRKHMKAEGALPAPTLQATV